MLIQTSDANKINRGDNRLTTEWQPGGDNDTEDGPFVRHRMAAIYIAKRFSCGVCHHKFGLNSALRILTNPAHRRHQPDAIADLCCLNPDNQHHYQLKKQAPKTNDQFNVNHKEFERYKTNPKLLMMLYYVIWHPDINEYVYHPTDSNYYAPFASVKRTAVKMVGGTHHPAPKNYKMNKRDYYRMTMPKKAPMLPPIPPLPTQNSGDDF